MGLRPLLLDAIKPKPLMKSTDFGALRNIVESLTRVSFRAREEDLLGPEVNQVEKDVALS